MKKEIAGTIESAEEKYKRVLEVFFTEIWGKNTLYSHGISHHRRVWKYARELIINNHENEEEGSNISPVKLLIACYLHDSGMSVNTGRQHGIHSSLICREFLRRNGMPEEEYGEVLSTVENHDNKEYGIKKGKMDLSTVLSVADDLDAFGYIGIYRYLEIYISRGIAPEKAGYLIRENALKRYSNFELLFSTNSELVIKHRKRFLSLDNFFENYNLQVEEKGIDMDYPSGYYAIACLISEILKNNVTPESYFAEGRFFTGDIVVGDFCRNFMSELHGS